MLLNSVVCSIGLLYQCHTNYCRFFVCSVCPSTWYTLSRIMLACGFFIFIWVGLIMKSLSKCKSPSWTHFHHQKWSSLILGIMPTMYFKGFANSSTVFIWDFMYFKSTSFWIYHHLICQPQCMDLCRPKQRLLAVINCCTNAPTW